MNMLNFSGKELLEMAIRIEENGQKFYREALKNTEDDALRKTLNYLVQEEEKHKRYFRSLLEKLPKDENFFDPYMEDAILYLKAMADSHVFTTELDGAELAQTIKEVEDVLNFAIAMEKDSLLFYYELARGINESDRGVIDKVIEEEKSHLERLLELKSQQTQSS